MCYYRQESFPNSGRGGDVLTEKKIIAELKDDSTDTLCMLISRYTAYVSAIVYRIIGNGRREDCEELTADIFVTLWNNRCSRKAGFRSHSFPERTKISTSVLIEPQIITKFLGSKKEAVFIAPFYL